MGCDGGTIPKRDELVRQKKKAEVKDKDAANMAKWRLCTLKHDALRRPIVADTHGLLYNKDAILEYLLDRAQFEHGPTYVKKMKDVKELQLTENPSFKLNHNDLGNEYLDVYSSPFICPVTGLEMNGKYKFCAIWTCGCVLSDRALRTVNKTNTDEKFSCPKCGQEYSSNDDDIIILNPEDDDIILMEQRRERLTAMNSKKTVSNKRKSPETEQEKTDEKKIKTNESATASSSTTKKIVSTTTTIKSSIQQDPTKSDLYKNLFTTSDSAKKKEKNKAHWVTYNPLYY